MNRVQNTKTVLWTLLGLAAAIGVTRFIFGLGTTTNLTDATPWGVWIGFDVMAGVALAGGGFVMTAAFYIFKREKYHDLVKPAVLTAFLGYIAVVFGLLFDLGLPWNIWHMMIYWNPHSPLFEVGWCVMLYSTVLALEFSPVPLEEFSRYAKIRDILMKLRFPLVMVGIMLSTLHQSSLGSLFLIMPQKMHGLWYSSIMPVLFFVSAVALGLMMVALESLASHWLYRRKADTERVAGLAGAVVWVLAVYLVLKLGDIAVAGEWSLMFDGSWESNLFVLELLLSAVIPIILFSIPKVRSSQGGQWIGSFLVVFGMIFNRMNVGGLSMLGTSGDSYVPSLMEVLISLGVVSAAGLVFLFAVERFRIWDKRPRHPEADPHAQPVFDYSSRVWLGAPLVASRTRYSLAFMLAFAVGFACMPGDELESKGVDMIPAQHALGGDTLFIDGNHDLFGTTFDHARHVDSLGNKESCVKCHHMNIPRDLQSACSDCHRNMYATADVFRHDWHADPDGGDIACNLCHPPGEEKQKTSVKACRVCHLDLYPNIDADTTGIYIAVSYVDAMHGQCVSCHAEQVDLDSTRVALTQCATCHTGSEPHYLEPDMAEILNPHPGDNVVLPEITFESAVKQGQ